MEPEKDLNEVIGEVTVNNPAMAAAEESVIMEEKPVAPKADSPVFADKPKKNGKGMVLGMVLLALLAAGGIGFGVWAWMEKGEAEKNLAIKITETSGKVTEMTTDKITSVDEDGTVTEITDTNITTVANPEDYLYVGEWGVKFKIPDNLELLQYRFYEFDSDNYGRHTLCVAGATTGHGDRVPSFLNITGGISNTGVCISKNTKVETEEGMSWQGYVSVDEYYIEGPQTVVGEEADKDWEVESMEAIRNMLSTDNMSEI